MCAMLNKSSNNCLFFAGLETCLFMPVEQVSREDTPQGRMLEILKDIHEMKFKDHTCRIDDEKLQSSEMQGR